MDEKFTPSLDWGNELWISLIWIALGVVAMLVLQARGAFAARTAGETQALHD